MLSGILSLIYSKDLKFNFVHAGRRRCLAYEYARSATIF
jgi:hypothetical protein